MAESKRTLLERIDINTIAARIALVDILGRLRELVELGQLILALTQQTKDGITMANQALTDLTEQFNVATNAVSARIDRLTQSLADVATPQQIQELTAIKDHLAALGSDPNNLFPAFRP